MWNCSSLGYGENGTPENTCEPSSPWEGTCPPGRPCVFKQPWFTLCNVCSCMRKDWTEGWRGAPVRCRPDTFEDTPPRWHREWESLGGGANTACRGDNANDTGGNATHGRDYQLHTPVFKLSDCQQLCLSRGAECAGVEYNQDHLRCELWTRAAGIGHWAVPSSPGFSCLRYGWPAQYLQPLDGGDNRACRGKNEADNSESYYNLYHGVTLEECKARCVHAPRCGGVEFSPDFEGQSRCEVWTRTINATAPRSGFACLRYDPSLPPATSTTVTTSPSATVLASVRIGPSGSQRRCVPASGVIRCLPEAYNPPESGSCEWWGECRPETRLNITVEAGQVCAAAVTPCETSSECWHWDAEVDCQAMRRR
mmetsp:Transcript_54975/g.176312  ORF Transcript_54975/g.176312 Transcript_54975/m.176312 type:complete len:367 (-) Transcript_54975:283-1383(-)